MSTEQFDAIIIGAGQSGGPLSTALGKAGWKTAIIERSHVGGTCVNVGCTPTKTMVASARIAHLVQRAADFGVRVEATSLDFETVRERKRDVVESFRRGSQSAIEDSENVELIFGEAAFTSRSAVRVTLRDGDSRLLSASTVIINAGGRPRPLDIPGLDSVHPLDSTSIMEIDEVPDRLLVVGGGPIGLEFAQMFQRFGSQVTIIERGDRLLSSEDEDIGQAMSGMLENEGIHVLYGAGLSEVTASGDRYLAHIDSGGCSETVRCDQILIAAGRVPNSDSLNLSAAGIEIDGRGYVLVDNHLRTNVDGIYALGDINGGPALTHVSYDDFRILRDNLLHEAGRSRAGRLVPYTIFTDPQLGRIGLTEQEARAKGLDVLVFKMPMSSVARAIEVDETLGLMKAVVDRPTGRILGASIFGIEGGEIAGAIQLAMMGNMHYSELRDGIFAHPTLIESLNNLFGSPVDQ